MEAQLKKSTGISLLFGASLATLTMVLHPMGGNLAEIARQKNTFIFSHSLAIFSIPFLAFGLFGLTKALITKSRLSFIGYAFQYLGLIAAMIAGIINGFVLPQFASLYADGNMDKSIAQSIRSYGNFINLSTDYTFIGLISIAILIWSLVIIQTKKLSKWLGYYGLLVIAICGVGIISNFNFTSVFGFGLFIFGIVSWKIIAGILLILSSRKQ